MEGNKRVLAMYDVRGIQKYLFRTSKMKDAIGASHIVETLFAKALEYASSELGINSDLDWCGDNGVNKYDDSADRDAVVLFIGGGNACVVYRTMDIAREVSKIMAKYTMERTYSLQLATALVEKTDNYSDDYNHLMQEMVRAKDKMAVSKPIDALPIIKVETKTGFPVTKENFSTESLQKSKAGDDVRRILEFDEKLFDNYVDGKGESSMLAAVHIDGNNMGLRIRELISDKTDYTEAVNEMRRISYAIDHSYKTVFSNMARLFEEIKSNAKANGRKDQSKYWIMKVIDAGDDITYVCNASIAMATVEYFCNNISKLSMKEGSDVEYRYRFSACAGISYFNSHFPFSIAYNVAEECCDSAKSRAKETRYRSGNEADLVGNWMDFQFCRNVHAQDLDRIRAEEYITATGENLLRRPYYLYSKELSENSKRFEEMQDQEIAYSGFQSDMKEYVLDKNNIPRSYVKELRNTYPLGEDQVKLLEAFLKSRKRNCPDNFYFKYYKDETDKTGTSTALLYDALEVADYYVAFSDLEEKRNKTKEEEQ